MIGGACDQLCWANYGTVKLSSTEPIVQKHIFGVICALTGPSNEFKNMLMNFCNQTIMFYCTVLVKV